VAANPTVVKVLGSSSCDGGLLNDDEKLAPKQLIRTDQIIPLSALRLLIRVI